MAKATEEKGTKGSSLPLGDALTVWRSAELKELLLGAVGSGGRVELELNAVEEADLTGLQLLCAAHRWAAAHGTEFAANEPTPALREAARRAGFTRTRGCLSGCLWAEEG